MATPPSAARWSIETRWSVVHAIREGDSKQKQAALEIFCETYWPPVYSFIMARGHRRVEAQDLTQEYFCRILRKEILAKAFQEKGKLRNLILTDLKFYLQDCHRMEMAEKRGGGLIKLSIDHDAWEAAIEPHLHSNSTPEEVYDRHWGIVIMDTTTSQLRDQFEARGRGNVFETLRGFLSVEDEPDYKEVAQSLDMTVNAAQSAVYRLRLQFRNLLRETVSATVANEHEVVEELRYLQKVLSS